jgi:hypothetical protein
MGENDRKLGRKNTIKVVACCYPGDTDNKKRVRALLEDLHFDVTEIDPPACPKPNKKIPCFSFVVQMDLAKHIIDSLTTLIRSG